MFTPDSIEVTSNIQIERTVYFQNINGATISSRLLRLRLLVEIKKSSNEGARHDYNNGSNFNND
jgi:hypothetical protein